MAFRRGPIHREPRVKGRGQGLAEYWWLWKAASEDAVSEVRQPDL